ncbi:hypothetical protein AAHT89_14805 [Klebsiella pneumoniae]|uniref:hypothetical protein n=3 Tax=Klebsiella pneumoniae TaxID=573 RepID=UPI000808BA9C|nr:hypothetical protein [Klebsiella pneumoniae]SBZ91085.1 Uncharacterised protein [Klebsiella pneumoniae]
MADNEKLGSTSPQVLLKNAINLDKLVNDRESESLPDRFDVLRRTWFGMEKAHDRQMQSQENRFDTFIASSGYEVIGDYTAGPLTFTEYNQLIRYNNELYKLTAATDIPYTTAGTTDETWNATDSLHFVSVGDAALRQNLGSEEPGFGTFMIMHKKRFRNSTDMAKIIDGRDGFNFTEVLPDNYLDYISPYLTAAETIDAIGDLYEFIAEADEYARLKGKSIWLPCGNVPISQPYIQNARSLRGIPGHSFLAAHTNFPSGEFLHKWSPTGGQRRLSNIGISYDGMGDTRGDYVGAFLIEDGCINSIVDRVFARNCWHGGIRISPQKLAGTGRDIVSLSATNIYLLDCGSAQDGHYAQWSEYFDADSGAWTDGYVNNLQLAGTAADIGQEVGPMALDIRCYDRARFNVRMSTVFTSTRLNTHFYADDNSRLLLQQCSFDGFSGETHKMINGVDTNGYYTSLPQVDIDAGLNARFRDFYNNGSLQNGGLRIRSGLYPVFDGMWFQPWQYQAHDTGEYLPALDIVACEGATFLNTKVRNIFMTTGGAPWKYAFTDGMKDNGTNTKFESVDVTDTPVVNRPLDFFSAMSVNSSTSRNYPTNAVQHGADIIFSREGNALVMGFPATANVSDDQTVQFPILDAGQSLSKYLYLTVRVKMTAGAVGNHYLKFQMWGTTYTFIANEIGKVYTLNMRFEIGDSTTLNRFIAHIGHSEATGSACSFTILDFIPTVDRLPYLRYKKTAQAV